MKALKDMKTLVGKSVLDVFSKLDTELEANAYKPISGGAGEKIGLTDIVPSYLYEFLNENFGPLGIGWGWTLHSLETVVRGDRFASTCRLTPFYRTEDGTHELSQVAGGSTNNVLEWAEKGALTNAISTGWHFAGWQSSIYKGKRSHKSAGEMAPKSAERPTKTTPEAPQAETKARQLRVRPQTSFEERLSSLRKEQKEIFGHDKMLMTIAQRYGGDPENIQLPHNREEFLRELKEFTATSHNKLDKITNKFMAKITDLTPEQRTAWDEDCKKWEELLSFISA